MRNSKGDLVDDYSRSRLETRMNNEEWKPTSLLAFLFPSARFMRFHMRLESFIYTDEIPEKATRERDDVANHPPVGGHAIFGMHFAPIYLCVDAHGMLPRVWLPDSLATCLHIREERNGFNIPQLVFYP